MKKNLIILALATFAAMTISTKATASQVQELQEEVYNYVFVEEKPSIVIDDKPMDFNDFAMWIQTKAKTPEGGKPGRVTCSFTITSAGEVINAKIIRGVDEVTDAAAVKLLESSPKWIPGKNDGKPVAVSVTIPVTFR